MFNVSAKSASQSAFTMVELAISLAIIGIALVAIVGVLPLGMNVQKDNREATIINQDASVFLEAIRNGTRGLNDLTNYVFLVTNYVTEYKNSTAQTPNQFGYTYAGSTRNGTPTTPQLPLNSGTNIIGLLSTPEFTDVNGAPINSSVASDYFSNHIVAYVRSLSGLAVEKPPQDNDILREGSLTYRIYVVNAPVAQDTNSPAFDSAYSRQLAGNLHELRLTFLWPQQPNGSLGPGRQTFRTLVPGQIEMATNNTLTLYFYRPQSFARTP